MTLRFSGAAGSARLSSSEGPLPSALRGLGVPKRMSVTSEEIMQLFCQLNAEGITVVIVTHEADIAKGMISISSPIARALIGKELGDVVEVQVPGGVRSYEILEIRYI